MLLRFGAKETARCRLSSPFVSGSIAVLLREEADGDDLLARVPPPDLYASGRFSGYVDLGEGRPGEQLGDASIEEPLKWARERAEVVLIRLFDSDYYSAGSRNPDPGVLPDWEDGTVVGRRRPRGLEMLDSTDSDPPVLWDLRLYPGAAVDPNAFAAFVQQDPRAVPVPDDATPASDDRGVRVFVWASTWAQAHAVATELFEEGRQRFCTDPPSGGWWATVGISVYPHAPGAAVRFG
ncbi:MAG TPA: hypothetical protein VFI54_12650 [Solirubrobacteraceae bacterium]|nr:hypothetical protein [Solirubrobacteraceae bacterium]